MLFLIVASRDPLSDIHLTFETLQVIIYNIGSGFKTSDQALRDNAAIEP